MRFLLGVLSYVVFALAWPLLFFHPKLREGIRERLGFYPANFLPASQAPRVWFHGASAGDILALLPTVRMLKSQAPHVEIVITAMTNSGMQIIESHASLFHAFTYLPYDMPCAVERAIQRIRPQALVLEYTELWPQLIFHAHAHHISLILHNGRLSERKLKQYKRMFLFTGNLLNLFSALLMRDSHEHDRARMLGADMHRVHITGNTKFDSNTKPPAPEKVEVLQRILHQKPDVPVWVMGSTHEGEEELLLSVFAQLHQKLHKLQLVIAPRYTERADKVMHLAQKYAFRIHKRSAGIPGQAPDILILDTIGELSACYSLATLVFVGGSFNERGGQNILEPAACGKPVLFGPNMANMQDAVQVLLGRAALQVESKEQLARVAEELLTDPEHAQELGNMGQEQVLAIGGAAERNTRILLQCLQEKTT